MTNEPTITGQRAQGQPLTKVVLRDLVDEGGVRHLWATRRPDGGIDIDGQDLGSGVERAFGPGLTEYEWGWRLEATSMPDVIAALGGLAGDDPLRVLAAWSAAHDGGDPGSHLKETGVPIRFWNRIGD